MADTAPFEIIAAPYRVYLAPVGTTFPDVSQAPGGSWALLGISGDKNITEDGVEIEHGQTIETFRPVGLTAPRKAFRTEEDLKITFSIADVSVAQYAKVLNSASVTAVSPASLVGGQSHIPLLRGMDVALFALVIRGDVSAGGAGFGSQYQVPIVYEGGSPAPTYKKGEPALLECEFHALWDSSLGFGRYISQTAAPS